MNVLITGGAGFIGSHLVEKFLKEKHRVIVVDNFDSFYSMNIKILNILESVNKKELKEKILNLKDDEKLNFLTKYTESDNYKLYVEDICNLENLKEIFIKENINFVINLAALAGVRPSILRPFDYERVNIKGFLNILELCKELKINKLIQASSSSVYGNSKADIFTEDTRVDFPISPYAATKKAGEEFGSVYFHLYGIDIIQLRFFTVYGERQRPDLAIHKFVKKIENDEEIIIYGDGSTSRDYTYIKDIINGIFKSFGYLNNHQNVYEIINLGSSRKINLLDMVKIIENKLSKKAKLKFIDRQAGDVDKTFACIEKAKKILNYKVSIKFEDGIENFVNWYRKRRV
ncbi:GDP-mannose 4,6-dehydratase [Fusobacterium animalis]|uniref:GDP-mannose 4,6-dehydratase n=1 Tax=Fusobacterium animalis TaxID=76859 RepID=UPI0035578309